MRDLVAQMAIIIADLTEAGKQFLRHRLQFLHDSTLADDALAWFNPLISHWIS